MDKDKFKEFLDGTVEIKYHQKFLSSESDGFVIVKPCETKCPDCDLTVDRAPIRTHKLRNGEWITYCKQCKNWQDSETGRYDQCQQIKVKKLHQNITGQ